MGSIQCHSYITVEIIKQSKQTPLMYKTHIVKKRKPLLDLLSEHIYHMGENVIVVSNDTDALFYCLIAAMKRKKINKKFKNEFWLELHYTSKTTGLSRSKKNLVSEFWDINNLIYRIENHLPDVEIAVLSLVILYLSGGSDLTKKWYS